MRLNDHIEGPTLRVYVIGKLSRRARVGLVLMRLGAELLRSGGVKDITMWRETP